jgi:hypothetical protein
VPGFGSALGGACLQRRRDCDWDRKGNYEPLALFGENLEGAAMTDAGASSPSHFVPLQTDDSPDSALDVAARVSRRPAYTPAFLVEHAAAFSIALHTCLSWTP